MVAEPLSTAQAPGGAATLPIPAGSLDRSAPPSPQPRPRAHRDPLAAAGAAAQQTPPTRPRPSRPRARCQSPKEGPGRGGRRAGARSLNRPDRPAERAGDAELGVCAPAQSTLVGTAGQSMSLRFAAPALSSLSCEEGDGTYAKGFRCEQARGETPTPPFKFCGLGRVT